MGDATNWNEDSYRSSILQEREAQARTVFRTAFAPTQNPNSPEIIVAASSDGSVAPYSISSPISSYPLRLNKTRYLSLLDFPVAEPLCFLQGHNGPAYDVKFYGNGEDALLLSCGDDGRIRGWRWKEINSDFPVSKEGNHLGPVLDLVNPQHKGPWGALSPIPENNAIATDVQGGRVFSAAGDACAYCWDLETGRNTMVFRGHSDYLHCIATHRSCNQIITGSEDGKARIWDCRTGKCTQVIDPERCHTVIKGQNKTFSWVSCIAVDMSESWLACGSNNSLSLWSLPACDCILRIDTKCPTQDVVFDNNQILAVGTEPMLTRFNTEGMVLSQIQCAPQSAFSVSLHRSGVTAVGGYGGVVDIISEFGSHLCAFRCKGVV